MQTVIENASNIKDSLDALCNLYSSLPKLIEIEHEALKDSDFEHVRKVTDEKNRLGEQIELEFARMQDCTERLSFAHAKITSTDLQDSRATGMYAVIDRLQSLVEASPGIAADVLSHVIEGIQKSTKAFEAKMIEVQPLIEMNKHIVNTLMESYRESYQFWADIAEEAASPYSEKGVQAKKGRNSGFVAKA